MKVLVCNDDGIEAPGLALLADIAGTLAEDVWIVGPDAKRTAGGTAITLARPLTLTRLGPRRYACSGTPADCVVAAMTWLFKDEGKPDLVLSGVNDGRNVAEDIAYSGTLGIAREATFWGVPAIGLSRVKAPAARETDRAWLAALVGGLWDRRRAWATDGHFLSINLPTTLPAAIVQPRIGRDKIGRRAELVREDGDVVEIVVPRGRAHATTEGDENGAIDTGHATINRLNGFGQTPLGQDLLKELEQSGRA